MPALLASPASAATVEGQHARRRAAQVLGEFRVPVMPAPLLDLWLR